MGNEARVSNEDVDYDAWQLKLTEAFFSSGDTETPVIMFLDEDELLGICPEVSDPVESLRAAVASELRQTAGPGVLDHIHRRMATWRRGSQDLPPPCLPLLAITVVAGSLMQNDGNFSSLAYYPRLVKLLSGRNNQLAARGLQARFDEVAELWTSLDTWILAHRDIVGPSTIDTHRTFNRIGYPLSQTIIRTSDRDRLGEFFDRVQVRGRPDVTSQDLLQLLRWWLEHSRGFSQRFVDLVKQGDGDSLLLSVITKLARQERAEPALSKGRARLELALQLDLERWLATWVIPVHKDLDSDDFRLASGSNCTVTKPDYGSNYAISGVLPDVSQSMNQRLRATGNKSVLVKDVRSLWILRLEPLSNMWRSTASVVPSEDHMLVVRETETADLKKFLDLHAEPGFRRLRKQLIHGWDTFADVRMVREADSSFPGMSFPGLSLMTTQGASASPKLVSGLPLSSAIGGRHYLAGGEPDLLLPVRNAAEPVSLKLDGRATGHVLKPNGSAFPLRLFGPFTDGRHVVEVDGITMDFFTHSDGEGIALRRPVHEMPRHSSPSVEPMSPPLFATCRRGGNAALWFVLPSGRVHRVSEPAIPTSLEELGFPRSYRWKVLMPKEAAWAVAERAGKFTMPLRAYYDPPNFEHLDSISRSFWRRIAQDTIGSRDPKWKAYLSQSMEDSIHGR